MAYVMVDVRDGIVADSMVEKLDDEMVVGTASRTVDLKDEIVADSMVEKMAV